MKIGLQLYNFRNALKEDFRGAMKEIARFGVDGVEFAGDYGSMEPAELKAFLDDLNLECAGAMFAVDALLDAGNIAYQYARILNSPAVTFSAFVSNFEEWRKVIENSRICGANAANAGTVFSFHNHWTEFALHEGKTYVDIMMESTDPAQVLMEPDICWLHRSGIDPVDFIRKYANRIRQVHLKDIVVPTDLKTTTELGNGVVPVLPVLNMIHEIPCQWLICEQDNSPDPFASAEKSLAFLKKNFKK